MFKITDRKGFHITFKNGVTISIQFGPGNYCQHFGSGMLLFYKDPPKIHASLDAEVAAWNKDGVWYDFDLKEFCGADPVANKNADEVLALMNHLANMEME